MREAMLAKIESQKESIKREIEPPVDEKEEGKKGAKKEEEKKEEVIITDYTKCPLKTREDDLKILGKFMQGVLEGWKHVDQTKIEVEDCSGYGGSKTYKLSCKDATPPVVGFHWRNEEVTGLSDQRAYAAAALFEARDAAPKRLGEGEDFFIDEWAGTSLGTEPHMYKTPRVRFTLVPKDDEHRLIFDKLTPESHK